MSPKTSPDEVTDLLKSSPAPYIVLALIVLGLVAHMFGWF